MKNLLATLAAGTLAASTLWAGCSGPEKPPPGDLDPLLDEITLTGDLQVQEGQSVAVIGYIEGLSRLGFQYRWEQLSGPTVIIANDHGAVLAFDMPAESVAFRLTVVDGEGDSLSAELTLTPEGVYDGAYLRRDHEVIEGNDVSLRLGRDHALARIMADDPSLTEDDAHDQLNETERFIEWRQIDGPMVEFDGDNPERILFTAPRVDADTVLVFEVTETMNSVPYSDQVYVYVNDDPLVVEDNQTVVSMVHAYRPDSPWREAVEECVYSQYVYTISLCERSRLPLLGQSSATGVPTIEEVLDRVVVSHAWMGARFEEFLRTRDPTGDYLQLFTSVTAVVLSYDVRPSFYSGYTGAIYIDPRYLWLLPEERDTLNEAPDYRSAYGGELQFLALWRYVENDEYAYRSTSSYKRVERTWDDYGNMFARLLYHELAHATDYFPPSVQGDMTGTTYADAYEERQGNLISDTLTELHPLTSEEMFDLAQVQYRGEDASEAQAGYSPGDVAGFFAPDLSSDFYSYNTRREDLAMIFEEVMMNYRFGILRDVAITNRPEILTGETVMVSWGQRGRVADPLLAERVALTVSQLMPNLNGQEVVSELVEPWLMRPGESWSANLVSMPPGMPEGMAVAPRASRDAALHTLELDARRAQHLEWHLGHSR